VHQTNGLATVRLRLEQSGVAASVVGGVITASSLGEVYEDTARQLAGSAPLAFLADFRPALWAVTADELSSFFAGAVHGVHAPAALIVSEHDVPLMQAHAWQVAQFGVIRKVFTCPERARAWVDLEASMQRNPRMSLGSL
jgi:hypothetical protein